MCLRIEEQAIQNKEVYFSQTERVANEVIQVTSYTPATLASKFGIPKKFTLLTIDAEGIEFIILKLWIEAGFRPLFVIIEVRTRTKRLDQTLMVDAGYHELGFFGPNVIWELM